MLCTEVHAHRDQICALEDAHAHTHKLAMYTKKVIYLFQIMYKRLLKKMGIVVSI